MRLQVSESSKQTIADEAMFLRGWMGNPLRTGAVRPSGRWLARAMAAEVDPHGEGPVVELGPGTGVVTRALLSRHVAPDRLVLVEYNREFCRLLGARFPQSEIVQGDAYRLGGLLEQRQMAAPSAIVSSLPLLLKPLDRRVGFVEECLEIGGPGMPLIQFSYGSGPPVPPGLGRYLVRRAKRVWFNLPPATVWIYSRPDRD